MPSSSAEPSSSQARYYKVKWTRVPDLVEKRKVVLKGGMAYVPAVEQASIVYQEFQRHLEKDLEVCNSGGSSSGLIPHSGDRPQRRLSPGWMKTHA